MRIIGRWRPALTTFLNAIQTVCISEKIDLRPSIATAAVLMDKAGAHVEDIKAGVVCIEAQGDLINDVCQLLKWVYKGHGADYVNDAYRLKETAGNSTMILASLEDDPTKGWLPDALDRGIPVVVVIQEGDLLGALWQALVARCVTLDDIQGDGVIRQVIAAVTGDASDLVPGMDLSAVTLTDLKMAVRANVPAAGCYALLQRLVRTRAELKAVYDAEKAQAALYATRDPEPLAEPVGRVIRKLSEMHGFGAAGEWGMKLAEDVQDYVLGLLDWSDLDKGALVYGPPGSGKTTFAQSLALECGIDLEVVTYADWQVSDNKGGDSTAKNMQKMMDKWRAKGSMAPFILFIDEIDTMGSRGGNGHNESWFRSQINTWLAFLDGAHDRQGVIVVAATNHPELVDPAMRRPGRLDRSIELPHPDASALEGIVRSHLRADGDLRLAAKAVRGRSPAEIERMCREARRAARREHRRPVRGEDLVAVARAMRPERHPDVRRMVSVHEAAHAVAALSLGWGLKHVEVDAEQPHARVLPPPAHVGTLAEAEQNIVILLAARAAEDILLGMTTSGPTIDLANATTVARDIHLRQGLGVLGAWHQVEGLPVPDTAEVMAAVRKTLADCQETARGLVHRHRAAIERVAVALDRDGYLDGAEVRRAMLPSLRSLARPQIDEPDLTPDWYPTPARKGHGLGPRIAA